MSTLSVPLNPLKLMLSDEDYSEVLKAMVMSSADDLAEFVAQFRDEEIPTVATYIVTKCNSIGVQQVLIFGGLLELFAAVTENRGHSELMRNMEDDLGVSRSQAYRCRAAWRCFGSKLMSDKSALDQFCRESLKLLAEERTPESAREEAMQLAHQHDRITIKVAKRLQQKHGVDVTAPPRASGSNQVSNKPARWLFSGSVVKIKLVHLQEGELADVPAVIRDLEAAIVELRRMNDSVTAA